MGGAILNLGLTFPLSLLVVDMLRQIRLLVIAVAVLQGAGTAHLEKLNLNYFQQQEKLGGGSSSSLETLPWQAAVVQQMSEYSKHVIMVIITFSVFYLILHKIRSTWFCLRTKCHVKFCLQFVAGRDFITIPLLHLHGMAKDYDGNSNQFVNQI